MKTNTNDMHVTNQQNRNSYKFGLSFNPETLLDTWHYTETSGYLPALLVFPPQPQPLFSL